MCSPVNKHVHDLKDKLSEHSSTILHQLTGWVMFLMELAGRVASSWVLALAEHERLPRWPLAGTELGRPLPEPRAWAEHERVSCWPLAGSEQGRLFRQPWSWAGHVRSPHWPLTGTDLGRPLHWSPAGARQERLPLWPLVRAQLLGGGCHASFWCKHSGGGRPVSHWRKLLGGSHPVNLWGELCGADCLISLWRELYYPWKYFRSLGVLPPKSQEQGLEKWCRTLWGSLSMGAWLSPDIWLTGVHGLWAETAWFLTHSVSSSLGFNRLK